MTKVLFGFAVVMLFLKMLSPGYLQFWGIKQGLALASSIRLPNLPQPEPEPTPKTCGKAKNYYDKMLRDLGVLCP